MNEEFHRKILIESPGHLRIRNRQVIIQGSGTETETWYPIDDIDLIVIDTPDFMISHQAAAVLSQSSVPVIGCDGAHIPSYELIPMTASSTPGKAWKAQKELDGERADAIWEQVVRKKILNQAAVLEILGYDPSALLALSERNPSRGEGPASAIYFRMLFGPNFYRQREGPAPNGLLNYGYSIISSVVAKSLLVTGFHLGFGIHHCGERNRIPLVSDIMEPFRPLVDLTVRELVESGSMTVTPETKRKLTGVLDSRMTYDENINVSLATAVRNMSSSLLKVMNGEQDNLKMPTIVR